MRRARKRCSDGGRGGRGAAATAALRTWSPRLSARLLIVLVAGAVLSTGAPAAAAAPDPPAYAPPVDAVVVDPFRPPATRFGPGNRGLEYGTEPGTPVLAAADGRVTFAGSVAGTLHVTVLHDDGVRTTYSFLQRVDVVVGQAVEQ